MQNGSGPGSSTTREPAVVEGGRDVSLAPLCSANGGWPFVPPDFLRGSSCEDDAIAQTMPRLIRSMDDAASFVLRRYYEDVFEAVTAVADEDGRCCPCIVELGASWTSHFPHAGEVDCIGVGVNEVELGRNFIFTSVIVQDVGRQPALPTLASGLADVVIISDPGSLTSPLELFGEAGRILRPGGLLSVAVTGRSPRPAQLVELWKHSQQLCKDGDGDHTQDAEVEGEAAIAVGLAAR